MRFLVDNALSLMVATLLLRPASQVSISIDSHWLYAREESAS
jgi:hypothetical protein